MDDEVRNMTNSELAGRLHELSTDYMQGCTDVTISTEREIMREAARRVSEMRDEASKDKKRYTCVMMGGGALIWLEGDLEKFRNDFLESDNYDESALISGIDQDGRQTYVVASKIEAIYDFGTDKPKRFDW